LEAGKNENPFSGSFADGKSRKISYAIFATIGF
jgi:hypothetical protein